MNLIDPTGMYIVDENQKEWNKRKHSIENKRDRLQNKVDKLTTKAQEKGWSEDKLAKKIGNKNERIASLNTTLSKMGNLEQSPQGYALLHTATGEKGGVSLNTKTNVINIKYNNGTASFVHEVTHAEQFETGDIAFDSNTGNVIAIDVYDEVTAYQAQFAYSPYSVSNISSTSCADSFNTITPQWVQGIENGTIYTPGGHSNTGLSRINVNSTREDLIKAYPNYSMNLLPAGYILKTSYRNIYYRNR